ncbi:hypothetical protein BIY29_11570 [Brenneria alni]|uniref:Type III secretion system effector protein n=1 Tax=Brenneria alni TaxID=71656 RepID=A0A421DN56_9GAMM|nr:hypothetical protein BIY29_11570 [Brenneria alni]
MDECEVINTSRDGFDWIGTQGLSTCIGICARGMTGQNEIILGVSHYTGIDKEPAEALQELRNKMDAQGARCSKMYLIGGAMSADPQLSTAEKERIMLSLRHEFNIQGVRLHPNICEDINADDHVNLLMTPDHIYFSTEGLFDSD